MRENPLADWKIGDIEKVCKQLKINFRPPSHGSHYKISSDLLEGALPVPARRPIKPIYIRKFVSLVDAHLQQCAKDQGHD
jgi:hypothetical protein